MVPVGVDGYKRRMRLYLVRHAQTAWNLSERAQGHTDIPLDEMGLLQAERLAERFRGVALASVRTSDLTRSISTAEPIAAMCGARICVEPLLRETYLGEWEGFPFEEIQRLRRLQADPSDPFLLDIRPPQGESPRDLWNRLEWIEREAADWNEPTAVVTHGGAGGMILARLLRGNIESARSFRFPNASVSELERRADGLWTLVRYACIEHLDGLQVKAGGLDGAAR